MIKVAFLINFNHVKWIGGLNIIVNLLNAVSNQNTFLKKIKLLIVVNNKQSLKTLDIDERIEIIENLCINNNFKELSRKFLVHEDIISYIYNNEIFDDELL